MALLILLSIIDLVEFSFAVLALFANLFVFLETLDHVGVFHHFVRKFLEVEIVSVLERVLFVILC